MCSFTHHHSQLHIAALTLCTDTANSSTPRFFALTAPFSPRLFEIAVSLSSILSALDDPFPPVYRHGDCRGPSVLSMQGLDGRRAVPVEFVVVNSFKISYFSSSTVVVPQCCTRYASLTSMRGIFVILMIRAFICIPGYIDWIIFGEVLAVRERRGATGSMYKTCRKIMKIRRPISRNAVLDTHRRPLFFGSSFSI